MSKLSRLENETRDSVVAVLADLSVRKLSSFVWYSKIDKKQALRARAAGIAFLDSAVLASIALDENTDIRREFIRIKNYVINSCPEYDKLSDEVDSLSHIAFYINNENNERTNRAQSLVDYW